MQAFGFVDDGLEYFLHHAGIEIATQCPCLARDKHIRAMLQIADALAVMLEDQRGQCVFLTFDEQPDEVAIDGIYRAAYVGEVTAITG